MEFVPNTEKVRTTVVAKSIKLSVDAEATSPIPIPLEITSVTISGATLQLDLSTDSQDEVNW